MQILWLTAVFHQLRFNIPVKSLGFFSRWLMRKNGIGMTRRQLFAVLRGTCLKNDRSALRRAGNIERSLHLKEVAVMVKRVQLRGIEKLTTLFIANKGILFP